MTTDVQDYAEGVRRALSALDRAGSEAGIHTLTRVRHDMLRERRLDGTISIAVVQGVDAVWRGIRELERYREFRDRLVERGAVQS